MFSLRCVRCIDPISKAKRAFLVARGKGVYCKCKQLTSVTVIAKSCYSRPISSSRKFQDSPILATNTYTKHSFPSGISFRYFHESFVYFEKQHTEMTEEDWSKKLNEEQFYVCRKKGTEAPFTGKYCDHFEKGIYVCTCCSTELFSSEHKFRSGCGWPSFHTALGVVGGDQTKSNVVRKSDNSRGMTRTEVLCKKCDSHLGHVFKDGPKPTGERFCINSVSLQFRATK